MREREQSRTTKQQETNLGGACLQFACPRDEPLSVSTVQPYNPSHQSKLSFFRKSGSHNKAPTSVRQNGIAMVDCGLTDTCDTTNQALATPVKTAVKRYDTNDTSKVR